MQRGDIIDICVDEKRKGGAQRPPQVKEVGSRSVTSSICMLHKGKVIQFSVFVDVLMYKLGLESPVGHVVSPSGSPTLLRLSSVDCFHGLGLTRVLYVVADPGP